jgi:hypothetical protein
MPKVLVIYRLIDNLCQKYGVVPSQLMDEDASLLLHMNRILIEAQPDEEKYGE